MFGAFNAAEQCLLADWIGGPTVPARRFRARPAVAANTASPDERLPQDATVAEVIDRHLAVRPSPAGSDFDAERRLLAERLAGVTDRCQALRLLTGLLSPANHHTPAGLPATRLFARLLDARG